MATGTTEHFPRTTKPVYLEEPDLLEELNRLDRHLPDLQYLRRECIWLRAKLGLDEKKDLQINESRLLQFSSMVDRVIDRIECRNFFAGSSGLRHEIQLLELKISQSILPVKTRLVDRLRGAQFVGKSKLDCSTALAYDSSTNTDDSHVSSNDDCLEESVPSESTTFAWESESECITTTSHEPTRNDVDVVIDDITPRKATSRQQQRGEGGEAMATGDQRSCIGEGGFQIKQETTTHADPFSNPFFNDDDSSNVNSEHLGTHFDDELNILNGADSILDSTDNELNILDGTDIFTEEQCLFSLPVDMDSDIKLEGDHTDLNVFDCFSGGYTHGDDFGIDLTDSECIVSTDDALTATSPETNLLTSGNKRPPKRKRKSALDTATSAAVGDGASASFTADTDPDPSSGMFLAHDSSSGMFLPGDPCGLSLASTGTGCSGHGEEEQQMMLMRRRRCLDKLVPFPRKPRMAEYMCSVCTAVYQCTVDENPWWAVLHHLCPHCNAVQVPRIDINAACNAIEEDPNFVALYGEGIDIDDDDFDDDDGDTVGEQEGGDDEADAEEEKRNSYPFDGEGMLPHDQASKLLVLMSHARTCSGAHASSKHAEICRSTKFLMLHIRDCCGTDLRGRECLFPWCVPCKHMLRHLTRCNEPDTCTVCNPRFLPESFQQLRALNEMANAQFCGIANQPING